MPEGKKTETTHKAWSAGLSSAGITLATVAAALLTGQVDVPPEAEVNGAIATVTAAIAAGVAGWVGAYLKRNWPK